MSGWYDDGSEEEDIARRKARASEKKLERELAAASPAERPEQTALPELAISADDKFRAATLKNMHALDRSGIIAAYKELAASYYCRERQLLTACNNYDALKQSHAALMEVLEMIKDAAEDKKAGIWFKMRKWIRDHDGVEIDLQDWRVAGEMCKIALATAKALTEGL